MIAANDNLSIDEALAIYFECLDRREPFDKARLLADFPQHAAALQDFFADENQVCAKVRALGTKSTPANRLTVRCPNCFQPTEVAIDSTLKGLHCSACGSRFSLVQEATTVAASQANAQIGRFQLVERLGMGAFGSVWKARDEQLDRVVAVKVPRQTGMSLDEQEKFFREARAAAQLRHPNIVSVHEVGRDGDAMYIVSDFVQGVTLADWLTGQQLTGREAAELCATIAEALEHAHEKGVVHRDLKPANIMMDPEGQPHLMDFGLARRDVGEITLTLEGQVLGTPAYMSPEQAEGNAHNADRRSDVYSLGVILFQLLTGELPFRGNVRMIIHQVIHEEPLSPRKLNASIKRDLETITLKCLEKDPARRYQSAKECGDELRRYLAGEPIRARPIGRGERAVRWVQRNRTVSTLAALAALLLLSGTIVSTYFAVHAKRQANLAMVREEEALRLKKQEEEARRDAEKQRNIANTRLVESQKQEQKASDVLKLLLEMLGAADPQNTKGSDYTVRQLVDDFTDQLGDRLKNQPEVEATIHATVGGVYLQLGSMEKAKTHLERALAMRRQLFGPDDASVAESLVSMAFYWRSTTNDRAAERDAKSAVAIARNNSFPAERLIGALGALQLCSTKHEAANAAAEEALALAGDLRTTHNPDVASILHTLSSTKLKQGAKEDAETYARQATDLHRRLHGPIHIQTGWSLLQLGNALVANDKLPEAEVAYRESREIFERYYSPPHHGIDAVDTGLITIVIAKGGKPDEIDALANEILDRHDDKARGYRQLAARLRDLGHLEQAVAFFKKAVSLDPHNAWGYTELAQTLWAQRKNDEALEAYRESVRLSPKSGINFYRIAVLCEKRGDHLEAARAFAKAMALRPDYGNVHARFAEALRRSSHENEAKQLHDEAKQLISQLPFVDRLKLSAATGPAAMDEFVSAAIECPAETLRQPFDALVVGELRLIAERRDLAEATIRGAMRGWDPGAAYFKSLGWCLLSQGKHDEARREFQAALKGLEKTDGEVDLSLAKPDQLTAAYFLDVVSEQQYIELLATDPQLACFPWFYIGQRREIEGRNEEAIKAYERCLELCTDQPPTTVFAYSSYRLRRLDAKSLNQE